MAPLEQGQLSLPPSSRVSIARAQKKCPLLRSSSLRELDLEWKLIYVGSADSESFDQELDTCMVGPVPVGINSFEFEATAPSPNRIPVSDLIGVTVILLTCSYNEQEFVRVGYYVNTEYEQGPLKVAYDKAHEVHPTAEDEGSDDDEEEEEEEDEDEEEEEAPESAGDEAKPKDTKGKGKAKIKTKEPKEPKIKAAAPDGASSTEPKIVYTAPNPLDHVDQMVRSVLGEKPRVTRFNIKWYVWTQLDTFDLEHY